MGKAISVSGKLEPIHFTVLTENDKQVVEVYMMKAGHFYRREFGNTETIKEMLSAVKADLFSIQFSESNSR